MHRHGQRSSIRYGRPAEGPVSRKRVTTIKDIENVKRWMNEKGLMALTFRSPEGGIDLDLLVKESHRFDELRASSSKVEFEGCDYYVASIADLIAMKREAGRPQDLLDIDQLEAIQRRILAD